MAAQMQQRSHGSQPEGQGVWWLIFTVGLVGSLVMVFRSQVDGDALNMLARGWRFAFAGEWSQYGMPTSAGGNSPGGLLSLLVGLPLFAWADFRAPALLVWLLGVAGFLMLDRIVGRVLGPSWRLAFAVMYWLNPWRIHYTSFLWNPSYMFFFGALHLWVAHRLRHRPRFWPSLALALSVGMAIQLHTSAMVLASMSLMVWWRGLVKLRWSGVVAGAFLSVASLVPWALLVIQKPELIPGGTGFPFRSLLLVQPGLRGLMYLVRYPSLALPSRVYRLDLVPGGGGDDPASATLSLVLIGIGWLTVLIALWAYRQFLRRARPIWRRREWSGSDRLWLRGYLLWCLVGSVLAFAASPTSVMFWQGFPAFHVASLVAVLMVGTLGHTRYRNRVRRLLLVWMVLSLLVVGIVSQSSAMFRRPPTPPTAPPAGRGLAFDGRLAGDHPMFHDLGIIDRCGLVVVGEGGFWPDGLPPPRDRDAVSTE